MPENLQAERLNIATTVNGVLWTGEIRPEETLLEFLREQLGLRGTKRSCEVQVCGACTVLVDDLTVSSCSYLAWEARGKRVLTIEGLAQGGKLDALQDAFIQHGALQCGYCTSGMIMMAKGLLIENPSPSKEEVRRWLQGSICRCGSYISIEKAILAVSETRR